VKRFLSLGAGVQSSTIALMIAHGEIEPVDAAIFADTQWEPPAVYEWLDWLCEQVPFPVHRVTRGSLRDSVIEKQHPILTETYTRASVPWHIKNPDGSSGFGMRQCTREFKLYPLNQEKRRLLGLKKGQRAKGVLCETLIGISTDEASRMRDSSDAWSVNVYPLIDARMSRADCLRWMRDHGYPAPPKSSCIVCPFHNDSEWRRLKQDPELWSEVVFIDGVIRKPVRGMRGEQFVHRKLIPIEEVDFSTLEDHGQINMFENECEGMCGV
jgi:3'-phosphoadenosine 5'-phosphosulfate sulfotransferase (PAPS reductase)/FAD synthetase